VSVSAASSLRAGRRALGPRVVTLALGFAATPFQGIARSSAHL
jgi:hypothetical protein